MKLERMTRAEVVDVIYKSRSRKRANGIGALDLTFKDFEGVDLRGIDLSFTNLTHSELAEANLRGANLLYADMNEASLNRAVWDGLALYGVITGGILLVPTPRGWFIHIMDYCQVFECFYDEVKTGDLAQDREIQANRAQVRAFLDICEKHIASHPEVIADLQEQWDK